ncbi:MAG: riboflavin kinase [Alistipes sp.]|nr:riboflavin kinase [Alistipes sp.]
MNIDNGVSIHIEGEVLHGRRLGRELGFPTANMEVGDPTIEGGVYASRVEIDGTTYRAMSNLGCNPSVGGGPRHLETHLFGFAGDLYGRRIRVELVRKIRDERRFDSLEALRRQIGEDRRTVLRLLGD